MTDGEALMPATPPSDSPETRFDMPSAPTTPDVSAADKHIVEGAL